ncbi:MAG: N-acetylmuramoyl-L-alanine amidase [Chthoniobacterales bacterium]|nr:MAG: N-acetylmuramoyl-L-alanine amidase [Chthoniobacterales bacterium]
MTITDHFLDDVNQDLLPATRPMDVRRALVIHFTGGATGASSIESMRDNHLSAHVMIERDGTVTQCVAFNRVASHAGVSRWRDPNTGNLFDGLNACSIGIEIANAGNDEGALKWARRQPGFASIRARHRKGGPEQEWESYPEAQRAGVFEIAQVLVETYHLDDITGHDCIAPERKDDPGPAFPMLELREACGFSGLPVVHNR